MFQSILGSEVAARNAEKIWAEREEKQVAYLPQPQTPYDGEKVYAGAHGLVDDDWAFTGRTVSTWSKRGVDFGFAYMKLSRILRENHVRRELRLQARHEKSGVKRRRLRSERWRKRFAHEVCSLRISRVCVLTKYACRSD